MCIEIAQKCGILLLGQILVRMHEFDTIYSTVLCMEMNRLQYYKKSEFLKIVASIEFGAIYDSRIRIR